ncbi:MAG: hypothetical protein IPM17_06645 [Verrucomicrobia bacterium]|nr:hypothetical protein [Verrucomicrobiota bacterium]
MLPRIREHLQAGDVWTAIKPVNVTDPSQRSAFIRSDRHGELIMHQTRVTE